MWVIKLGGSLADSPALKCWLDFITEYGKGKCVIVPGGGVFADLVRQEQKRLDFNAKIAHAMALKAMQQMALMFEGLNRQLIMADSTVKIRAVLQQDEVAVWSPDITTLDRSCVPNSWDVTSDSLSAWLASELGAGQLVLVKSADIPSSNTLAELADRNIVDKAFCQFFNINNCEIKIYNRDHLDQFGTFFKQSYSDER